MQLPHPELGPVSLDTPLSGWGIKEGESLEVLLQYITGNIFLLMQSIFTVLPFTLYMFTNVEASAKVLGSWGGLRAIQFCVGGHLVVLDGTWVGAFCMAGLPFNSPHLRGGVHRCFSEEFRAIPGNFCQSKDIMPLYLTNAWSLQTQTPAVLGLARNI